MNNPHGRYILDADGNPVPEPDLMAWGAWLEAGNRQLAYTEIGGRYWVSTVFLGLDHNYSGEGPPVLWETMTFETIRRMSERVEIGNMVFEPRPYHQERGDQQRYTSKEAALKGHARAVAIVERWCQEQDAQQHRDDPEFLKMDEMADLDDLRRQEELDEDQ